MSDFFFAHLKKNIKTCSGALSLDFIPSLFISMVQKKWKTLKLGEKLQHMDFIYETKFSHPSLRNDVKFANLLPSPLQDSFFFLFFDNWPQLALIILKYW